MPVIKAKPVRLIDVLNIINVGQTVILTFNSGRNSCSNSCCEIERIFKTELGCTVKGITCVEGVINFII